MRLFVLLALLPLTACVAAPVDTPPGDPKPQPPAERTCGAAELQGLVGQPATVLQTMRFAGPVRVIEPGMAVTMDYSPARLNFDLDGQGLITRAYCG